jgi:alginate O-acetyltransferase complex protein AlgI
MLFNTLNYAVFLGIVFVLYWFVAGKYRSAQNLILLAASYFFYGSWDWRFLFLLIFSTALDFSTGFLIHRSTTLIARKSWLIASIVINLGFLIFFKYFNFFVTSFAGLLRGIGFRPDIPLLNIILPVGISFYTFHGLSYVLDIYNKKIKPTTNFVDYSVFVSFFPLLVAGPIERASHLLPQISKPRTFDYRLAADGLRQILWGLFKKMVIADSCDAAVNAVFANPDGFSRMGLIVGAILFSFQIYGDFSGYTDIAIGSGRLLGFDLLRNFSYPYFSRDIAEFWRRWHISLTSWFRDYVYIPLGGSKKGVWQTVRNTLIVFLISGIWHGANWTFAVWGFYHAALFIPLLLLHLNHRYRREIPASLPTVKEVAGILTTFLLVTIGWIIFRSESLAKTGQYFADLLRPRGLGNVFQQFPEIIGTLVFIVGLLLVEWVQKNNIHGLYMGTGKLSRGWRFAFYCAILLCIVWFGAPPKKFIYFQF